jgi:hypothetical protein
MVVVAMVVGAEDGAEDMAEDMAEDGAQDGAEDGVEDGDQDGVMVEAMAGAKAFIAQDSADSTVDNRIRDELMLLSVMTTYNLLSLINFVYFFMFSKLMFIIFLRINNVHKFKATLFEKMFFINTIHIFRVDRNLSLSFKSN